MKIRMGRRTDGSCMERKSELMCAGDVIAIGIEGSNITTEFRLCEQHLKELRRLVDELPLR